MKLLDILKFSEEYLKKYSFSKPRLESEKIISHVLNLERITLYAYFDMELTLEQKEKIKNYLKAMARNRLNFDELPRENENIVPEKDCTFENRELLQKSIEYLAKNEVLDSKLDAEYIFAHVLNVKRTILSMNLRKEITAEETQKIKELLHKRAKEKKPLQYLLGEWEFYGLPFKVDERVLIPRADTEILVEQCKFILKEIENPKVLDIGTGSGAISVTIAKEVPNAMVLGADISTDALDVAVENRKINNVENNLKFIKSDIFSNIKDTDYDMIISNPPYIPQEEYEGLMPEVKLHEPQRALTDNGDGYYFYKKISEESPKYLKDGGYLAFEVGYNQAEEVSGFMKKNGFDVIAIVKDYGGIERVVIGRKSGEKGVDKVS
ncbi:MULTISPECIES: peptide chain release factor N(5)-glutamine methyltransferase [Cetobacterium]|jgi:release factor glutamine methyltransferase|uniref:Release factor glutamine methyltransferase n=1 Tax=Candidatus Cetobacterium colombiensis TaxID=3073100 RepID=A0ABU4WBT3_9FUSO|nr:peptide chain release factor N(5)-glutamine methyltransferase [Candidatus Cetobacterium colombiensis]MDX8336976.1 peptide chain release factor N(5)-glutamine methyltransferase [Candidatus Cetobacterium colombiensis]